MVILSFLFFLTIDMKIIHFENVCTRTASTNFFFSFLSSISSSPSKKSVPPAVSRHNGCQSLNIRHTGFRIKITIILGTVVKRVCLMTRPQGTRRPSLKEQNLPSPPKENERTDRKILNLTPSDIFSRKKKTT